MDFFGWLLFVVGGVAAFIFGGIGTDGVANVAGTFMGCALLVSGSVFVGAATVRKAMLVTIMVKGKQIPLKPIGDGGFVAQIGA